MNDLDRQAHWQSVYATKAESEVSWFQEDPAPSLDLVAETGISADASIIDVGGRVSRLVMVCWSGVLTGLRCLTYLRKLSKWRRSGSDPRGEAVAWIVADVTTWNPPGSFDLWHDRAAFHFLTDPADREAYVACLKKAVRPAGHVIIATFAPDGPEKCSGLPIVRYDPEALAATLGPTFELVGSRRHHHLTPGGNTQQFQFSRFLRR